MAALYLLEGKMNEYDLWQRIVCSLMIYLSWLFTLKYWSSQRYLSGPTLYRISHVDVQYTFSLGLYYYNLDTDVLVIDHIASRSMEIKHMVTSVRPLVNTLLVEPLPSYLNQRRAITSPTCRYGAYKDKFVGDKLLNHHFSPDSSGIACFYFYPSRHVLLLLVAFHLTHWTIVRWYSFHDTIIHWIRSELRDRPLITWGAWGMVKATTGDWHCIFPWSL